jgi:hypothetical protein
MQDGGLENMWLMDSLCSCHMIRSNKWFSSLDPMIGKEYITFGVSREVRLSLVALFE